MDDVFDHVANMARDVFKLLEGDALPYSTDAERIANGRALKVQHKERLAGFIRHGGNCSDFRVETMHLHGGVVSGLPLRLATRFQSPSTSLSGADCWDMIMAWLKSRGQVAEVEPWPGLDGTGQVVPDRFTVDEVKEWIRTCGTANMKAARKSFLAQKRAKGLTALFEDTWRRMHGRARGRPRKQ